MTALDPGTAPAPPVRSAGTVWTPVHDHTSVLPCTRLHLPDGGRLDEKARRLDHEELAVARLFAREGHDVRSLPESRRGGRKPDLMVCATTVEIKSFIPEAERRRPPSAFSVWNKLVDASGQSPHAVLNATGSGLSESTARRGMARYAADPRSPVPLSSVRILGDGFELAWARRPSVQLRSGLPAAPERTMRGFGLGV